MIGVYPINTCEFRRGSHIGVLGLVLFTDGGRESRFRSFHRFEEFGVLFSCFLGQLVEDLGVFTFGGELGLGMVADALLGGPKGSAQTLMQCGDLLPLPIRLFEGGNEGAFMLFELRDLRADALDAFLNGGPASFEELFGFGLGGKTLVCCDEFVGEEAGFRVTDSGLDEGGFARGSGLSGQRAELALDLLGEVEDAHEVVVHVREFAERAFFSAPVFEDSGGFFNKSASFFRACLEDRVESALADDDVHLTTHARVGEEFLNVEESSGSTVDRVFGAAAAKECPGDRDFRVVDRQHSVSVVDRQIHLCAAEGGACSCTGEDHV